MTTDFAPSSPAAQVLAVPVEQIVVPPDRARQPDPAWVEALAGMIREQGLLQPILVAPVGRGGYELIAGHTRLLAVRALGHITIAATVAERPEGSAGRMRLRLAELMENLGRAELIPLDRCRSLAELKQVYETLHPEVRHGGDRRSVAAAREADDAETSENPIKCSSWALENDAESQVFGFSKAVAQQVGMSQQAIRRATLIWKNLSPASRARLPGTSLADNQSELELLSKQSAGMQKRILELILDDTSVVTTVRGAMEAIKGGTPETPMDRKFRLFSDQFQRLPPHRFDHLIAMHEELVMAALRRMGRI